MRQTHRSSAEPDEEEPRQEVVAKCDHLAKLKFSKALPFAFTEHGTLMAASGIGQFAKHFDGLHNLLSLYPLTLGLYSILAAEQLNKEK